MKVCGTVGEINVYPNNDGSITISQESICGDDQAIVVIHPELVPALCKALRSVRKDMIEGP